MDVNDVDGVRWVSLTGSRGNALDRKVVAKLHDAVSSLPDDVSALVLRSEGRHFSVGFDLRGLEQESDASLLSRFVDVALLLAAVRSASAVTIACLTGWAIGAGADLALACDHRIGSPDLRVRFPGARFGVVLGRGQQAARLTPYGSSMALAGEDLDAERALRAGVITEIADGDLRARAAALAAGATTVHAGARRQLLGTARVAVDEDGELAALVRSAVEPGLCRRLADYAAATL